MKKLFTLTAVFALCTFTASARSLVLTLGDRVGTKVYYLIDETAGNKPVMHFSDGTVTIGARNITLQQLTGFTISDTDFTEGGHRVDGDKETAVTALITDDALTMQGNVRVYTLDGRLVMQQKGGVDFSALPAGNYVITNGKSIVKISRP